MSRLTTFSKIIIFIIGLAAIGGILWFFGLFGNNNTNDMAGQNNDAIATQPAEKTPAPQGNNGGNNNGSNNNSPAKLQIALDEWHGWKPVIDANKGVNSGRGDSIFQALGLDVEISVINDDEESLQKFINGEVVAFGQSVNEWPYVYARLEEAGVSGKMVLLTDRSAGGDGIVTTANISGIEGLAGHTIAVSKYSAAHIMTEWLLKTSSLSPEEIDEIKSKMVFTNSSEETFEMLSTGKADVASFWEPYITLAHNSLGAKVLFTTKSASNLMIDGIVFREDFLKEHSDVVERFVEGTLRANNEYTKELRYIRELDDYAGLSDEEIFAMSELVSFANFADNKELFDGIVQVLYKEMADVWKALGEKTVPSGELTAFSDWYLLNVEANFQSDKATSVTFNEDDRSKSSAQSDTAVLLKRTLTINFEPNVAIIREDSYSALDEFAQIAKILNGSIIQVEGNIADTGVGDTESGRMLSEQRAKAVCDHLKGLGIDETRLIYKGNGITKPVAGLDPKSAEGMQANRRTDIFFMSIE